MRDQRIDGFFKKIEVILDKIKEKEKKGFESKREMIEFRNQIAEELCIIQNNYVYEYIDYKATINKEDFQKQFDSAAIDLSYEIENYKNFKNKLEHLNEILDNQMFHFKSMKNILEKMSEDYVNSNKNNKKIIVENFENDNSIDLEMIKDTPVNINTENGYITINNKGKKELKASEVIIMNDSVGFPGNTHEATIKNNKITFLGSENLNVRINNLIENNKMFSFENISINKNDLDNIESKTYIYKENVSWDSAHEFCYLELMIKFEELQKMNELKILPGLSSDKDVSDIKVESIYITDKQGGYQEVIDQPINLFSQNTFIFNEQNVKEIVIKLRQEKAYTTKIGYLYSYLDSFQDGINYTIAQNEKFHSLNFLGMNYNKVTDIIKYPSTNDNNKYSDEEIKRHLFEKPLNEEFKKYKIDLIRANKFNISVETLSFHKNDFENKSVFISKNIYNEDEIRSVSIKTNEMINTKEIIKDAFKYSISHDNGNTWTPINPLNRFNIGDTIKIFFNAAETKNNLNEIINTEEPIHNIRLRVELNQIENRNIVIPVLKSYELLIND